MWDFLKNNGLWVLFAAAVISVLMAAASLFTPESSPGTNLLNIAASPFRAGALHVADWINDKQNYYRDTTALQEENAALRKRVAEMEEAVRQAESDSEENARLRSLLEVRAQHRDLTDLELARVTERNTTNWTASLTLDKGTMYGIAKGNSVIDDAGALVGVVSEAGVNWCRVRILTDTETSLGAQVFRTKELGVVEGDFSLMSKSRMRLDYLPADCKLLEGDVVITSGFGGYYPPGLVIGSVEEVQRDDSGSASYAILEPKADFASLAQVAVVKSFEIVT
ncbi:MAG: rod shape-determining protein MreC [Oscillibacter sp.]|nr:rod shape-determining protein MreC [Oscillibacter sp.]